MRNIEWGNDIGDNIDTEENGTPLRTEIDDVLDDIQTFAQTEDAFDYSSSQSMYEYLKKHLTSAYVSDIHVYDEDLSKTFYVVAKDQEAYDKYEENITHQHHPEVDPEDKWG